ncbi:hypothetical protein RT99_20760 [Flavobacterium sp. MEB061]|uniref:Ig-like domain-containing protein n=2 Tax=Flavobacterium sp. MEB061 TaxID=1587524 RepID=UPI0005B6A23F|nr:Ig-like domain-containing protein [Flavobacterium sp. MEB061]KIQ16499.1 hypothetical protein RT99_20760 [Flavobacterium sp. MEB061]
MIKNYFTLNKILNFKKTIFLFFLLFIFNQVSNAQCSTPIVGCSNTDLSNFGSDSNNNAATIEYDNFVSSFHTTVVRTSDGSFQVWGEDIGNDGLADVLSPLTINVANFPALTTATPLKVGLGSISANNVQGIVLATDGLYAWSKEGIVLDGSITSGTAFQKITIGGNANGLPTGVTPGDVKMLFATYKTLAITTCSGDVWVISQTASVRGNGGAGNATTWYKVTTNETGNPFLSDVVVCRGNYDGLMALKSDGTVYVWGVNVLLGDNTAIIPSQTRAIQMALPGGTPKMIGSSGSGTERSYYILATDGNMYAVGENTNRQLGDWTTIDRLGWVQPRYTSVTGPLMENMDDIKWFSVQEHDNLYGSVNVINSNKNLYAFGQSNNFLLGTASDPSNPSIPAGLTVADKILAVETGGHTSMIVKSCQTNFGYVGHRIRGSMGNGSNGTSDEKSYNFATAAVQICGAESNPVIQPISTGGGPGSKYCVGDPVLLNPTPAGGTLSIVSGPGSLTGNTLSFTSAGTVVVQYSVTTECGGTSVTTKNFEAALCPIDLEVTKTVDNINASVGNNCVFTITTTNKGPYKATGVNVNDVLPAGYTFVSATPSVGTWSAPNWTVGSLINGESATLSIVATVNASGPYANTAIISGNDPDTNSANNTATATPVVDTNLLVTKTASTGTHNVGDNVTFTITASNSGPSNATGVKVTDTLPAGYTFVSATPSTGTWLAPDWTIGNLANGANATLTIVAKVNATGSYANTASITGEQNDPTPGNNSESATPTVNHAPVAIDDDLSASPLNEDGANGTVNVLSNDTDPDGNPIAPVNGVVQFTVDLDPALPGIQTTYSDAKGVWTLNPSTGIVTFNPADNYNGTAIITYTLCDPFGLCDNADITFVVAAVNDNPVAVDDIYTVAEDATVTLNPLALDSDLDGDTLSITSINGTTLTGGVQTITVTNGTVNISAAGVITFTPSANFNSATVISIPYVINDGHGGTATANQLITVTAVNDNPVAVDDIYTVAEDATVTLNPLALDSDLDGDTLSITSINGTTLTGTTQTITVTNGTVNISAVGVITFTPSANFNSATAISIPYVINDGHGGTDTANQLITVTAVNDNPVAVDDIYTIAEDATVTLNPLALDSDLDGDTLSITSIGGTTLTGGAQTIPVTNGTVNISAAGVITFTPSANFNSATAISIPYVISDGHGGTATANQLITVTAVNDNPVAVNDVYTVAEDATVTLNPLALDSDLDGDTLSITSIGGTILTGGAQTIPVTNGTVNISAAGVITFTPSANFNSAIAISIPYLISDGNGGTATANQLVTVNAVNDSPTAADDINTPISSTAGATALNVLSATDIDGTISNYTVLTLPSHGILALAGVPVTVNQILTPLEASMLTYEPSGTFTGNDTFTFTATDDLGAIDLSAGTITIPVGNNAPVANDDTNAGIPSTAGATAINPLTATDTDGTVVSYTILTLPANGTLALSGTPVTVNQVLTPLEVSMLTYDPSGAFSGNETFTFTATDNNGSIDATPAIITIVVEKTILNAVNDPVNPVVGIDKTVTIVNVFDNDTLNNNPLIPTDVDLHELTPDPTGTITLKPDGTVELIPNAPAGNYTLTYEICEKANPSNCSPATVTVSVVAPTMTITANSYCDNNAPYVSYNVVADNFTPTGLLTINWIDSANNIVATQNNMPLSGTVLWPGAVVDSNNKPTDWPGWVLVNGQWIQGNDGFELTRPAVTMQFTLNPTQSVVVNYPAASAGCNAMPTFGIHAGNEDEVTLADGLNGSLEVINVLDNDTLNGVPVKPSDVIVKGIDWPTGITLNNDGTINIAPGTKGGEHTLTYQICEVANGSNCTTATVKIFVEIPAIAIVKTVVLNDDNGNGFAEAGETLTYNFAITNKGNVALEKIMVSDPLPGIVMNGGPINLAVGETDNSSITGTYTLSQADVDSGSISNQATASGTTKSGIIVSDKSDSSDTEGDKPTILELGGCVIKIFNAVSANGDNQNERFYIQGLECYPDNSVQIFNRWGVLVFEREHYNNADIAFRGVSEGRATIKDSNGLPEGTYYYIIRYKDKQSNLQQEAGYLYLTK